jgi:hypothetical protein
MYRHTAARLGVISGVMAAAAVVATMPPLAGSAQPQHQLLGVLGGARGPAPVPARKVDLRALPDVTTADIAARPGIRIGPLTGTTASVYAARKAIAARGGSAGSAGWAGLTPNSAPPPPPTRNPQINFAGNTQRECGNAAPADQALAIGDKNQILQINQDCLSVWSAAGKRLLGPKTLQAFAGLPPDTYVFDPRALYDWYNHRFILGFGDSNLANNGYYDIAVSQGDDPTRKWNHYRFLTPSQNQVFNDFLRMGQDRQGVYLASNLFPMQGSCCGPFLWEEWVLLPKSLLYAGQPLSYWYTYGFNVNGVYTDSTQPANVWSPYDNPRAEFLLGSFNINFGGGNCVSGCSGLVVWALSNQFGWLHGSLYPPETSGYCCAGSFSYFLPPQAGQPGAPNSIDTLDTRITGEVTYNSGLLHAALTTADNTWSDIQVYRISPFLDNEDPNCSGDFVGACPRLTGVQTLDLSSVSGGNGKFYYYPTPQPDLEGNVTIVYNYSGACDKCYPSLGYVSQRVTQPGGSFFDNGLLLAGGKAVYKGTFWGRYTAVAPAGVAYTAAGGAVDTPGAGFAGAFAKADGSWGTQIGYTAFTAPNQP